MMTRIQRYLKNWEKIFACPSFSNIQDIENLGRLFQGKILKKIKPPKNDEKRIKHIKKGSALLIIRKM